MAPMCTNVGRRGTRRADNEAKASGWRRLEAKEETCVRTHTTSVVDPIHVDWRSETSSTTLHGTKDVLAHEHEVYLHQAHALPSVDRIFSSMLDNFPCA